jgi:hypothetical protein
MNIESDTVDLKFASAPGLVISVAFEPVGTSFDLEDGDFVVLRTPKSAIESMEFHIWTSCLSVWVPYARGEVYMILDRNGKEIDRL